jgi:hypothetical protein
MNFRRKPGPLNDNLPHEDNVIEDHMNKCKSIPWYILHLETIEKINVLSNAAASIRRTTMNIKTMMVDDEALVGDIDKGLVKN